MAAGEVLLAGGCGASTHPSFRVYVGNSMWAYTQHCLYQLLIFLLFDSYFIIWGQILISISLRWSNILCAMHFVLVGATPTFLCCSGLDSSHEY